jgi:hypothetical protein
MSDKEKLAARYGKSEQGNFFVCDTIGVPHPYCITDKHVTLAADNFSGILSKEAIENAEKHGAKCGICKGKLSFAQHEQALLVECRVDMKQEDGSANPELHAYLLKCKEMCEQDKYAGFAFLDRRG